MFEKRTFRLEGMSCAGCVGKVKRTFENLPGVQSIDVEIGRAVVDSCLTPDQLASAFASTGFKTLADV